MGVPEIAKLGRLLPAYSGAIGETIPKEETMETKETLEMRDEEAVRAAAPCAR